MDRFAHAYRNSGQPLQGCHPDCPACEIDALKSTMVEAAREYEEQIVALKAEVARLATGNLAAQHRAAVENTRLREALRADVLRLNSLVNKTLTYCAYCGSEFQMDGDGSLVAQHIAKCEKHPMRKVEADNARLRKALEGLLAVASDEHGCAGQEKYFTLCLSCRAVIAARAVLRPAGDRTADYEREAKGLLTMSPAPTLCAICGVSYYGPHLCTQVAGEGGKP